MPLVLSAKVRRNLSQNERLCQTLDIANVFDQLLASKFHSNLSTRHKPTNFVFCDPPDFYIPT